jgi:hypothetical protein
MQEAFCLFGDAGLGIVDGCLIENNTIIESGDSVVEVGHGSFCHNRMTRNTIINSAFAIILHLGGQFVSSICDMEFDNNDIIQIQPGWATFAFVNGVPNKFTLHSHHNIFHVKDHTFVANQANFAEDHNYYHLENTVLGFMPGEGSVVV